MAEGARLESVYTGNCIEGSNPSPSARFSARAAISRLNGEGGPKLARPRVTGEQRDLTQISKLSL